MRVPIICLSLLATSACSTVGADAAPDAAPAGTCKAQVLGQFKGQQATQQLGADMLTATGANTIRWVPSGMMVTMEYRPGRVTVMLDEQNRVSSASCS